MANLQYPNSYTETEVPLWVTFKNVPYTGIMAARGVAEDVLENVEGFPNHRVRINMPKEYAISDRSQYSMGNSPLMSTTAALKNVINSKLPVWVTKLIMGGVKASGIVMPQSQDAIFKGSDIRKFHFNFDMVPKDVNEAKEITKICDAFRQSVYQMTAGMAVVAGAMHPMLWIIQVENEGGSVNEDWDLSFQPAVLAECLIDREPHGPRAMSGEGGEDFYPHATKLTLVFYELEPNYFDASKPGGGKVVSRSVAFVPTMIQDLLK